MGWEKAAPRADGPGWGWFLGAIPDPVGCLPWTVCALVAALAVAWALLT